MGNECFCPDLRSSKVSDELLQKGDQFHARGLRGLAGPMIGTSRLLCLRMLFLSMRRTRRGLPVVAPLYDRAAMGSRSIDLRSWLEVAGSRHSTGSESRLPVGEIESGTLGSELRCYWAL